MHRDRVAVEVVLVGRVAARQSPVHALVRGPPQSARVVGCVGALRVARRERERRHVVRRAGREVVRRVERVRPRPRRGLVEAVQLLRAQEVAGRHERARHHRRQPQVARAHGKVDIARQSRARLPLLHEREAGIVREDGGVRSVLRAQVPVVPADQLIEVGRRSRGQRRLHQPALVALILRSCEHQVWVRGRSQGRVVLAHAEPRQAPVEWTRPERGAAPDAAVHAEKEALAARRLRVGPSVDAHGVRVQLGERIAVVVAPVVELGEARAAVGGAEGLDAAVEHHLRVGDRGAQLAPVIAGAVHETCAGSRVVGAIQAPAVVRERDIQRRGPRLGARDRRIARGGVDRGERGEREARIAGAEHLAAVCDEDRVRSERPRARHPSIGVAARRHLKALGERARGVVGHEQRRHVAAEIRLGPDDDRALRIGEHAQLAHARQSREPARRLPSLAGVASHAQAE